MLLTKDKDVGYSGISISKGNSRNFDLYQFLCENHEISQISPFSCPVHVWPVVACCMADISTQTKGPPARPSPMPNTGL